VDSTHLKSTVGAASEAKAGAACTVIVPQVPPQKSFLPVEGPSNIAGFVPTVTWYFDFELDSDSANILPNESGTSGGGIASFYFCMDERQTAKYNFWDRFRQRPIRRPTRNPRAEDERPSPKVCCCNHLEARLGQRDGAASLPTQLR
jgi:hypothetical protein